MYGGAHERFGGWATVLKEFSTTARQELSLQECRNLLTEDFWWHVALLFCRIGVSLCYIKIRKASIHAGIWLVRLTVYAMGVRVLLPEAVDEVFNERWPRDATL